MNGASAAVGVLLVPIATLFTLYPAMLAGPFFGDAGTRHHR
jgi:hypothetical protein